MNKRKEKKLAKYYSAIDALPATRGTGNYNANISSVTAHGIHLNLSVDDIKHDLTIRGKGCYQVNEVENAYRSSIRNGATAWNFNQEPVFQRLPYQESSLIQPTIDRKIKTVNHLAEIMDLLEVSPYRLLDTPQDDLTLILQYGFKSDEYVFIGDTYDTEVIKVEQALKQTDKLRTKPFFCINPFTGRQAETNNGRLSYRAEKAISFVRYMLIEMDETTIAQQVGFWIEHIKSLPVFAIIDSGKKSLHGWIKVDCSPNKWDINRNKVFDVFKPFGIDKACKNKSRLSRTASHHRDGGRQQCLLYFNPQYGVA